MLFLDVPIDRSDLLHVQFACQNDYVGELGIELQCLGVGDVELGGKMHLLTNRIGILHDRDVGRDDRIDSHFMGLVHDLTHERQVFGVHDRVHREIGLYARLTAGSHDSCHIVGRKIDRTTGTHIQVLDTEIDTGSSGLNRRSQTLPASYGCHYFYGVISFQHSVFSRYSAICTALSAAPLRIWSLTHQKLSPFSSVRSLRIRPTKTSSLPLKKSGIGYILF